jgi:hypothetical protein
MTSPQTIEVLPQVVHISFYQGDDFLLDVAVTDPEDGSPIDVSGMTPKAQIRHTAADPTVLAEFAIDSTDAATGLLHLSISSTVTTALPETGIWDVQLTSPKVSTIAAGNVLCTRQVTR